MVNLFWFILVWLVYFSFFLFFFFFTVTSKSLNQSQVQKEDGEAKWKMLGKRMEPINVLPIYNTGNIWQFKGDFSDFGRSGLWKELYYMDSIDTYSTSQMVQINMKPLWNTENRNTDRNESLLHNYSFWLLTFSIEPKGKMTKLLEWKLKKKRNL